MNARLIMCVCLVSVCTLTAEAASELNKQEEAELNLLKSEIKLLQVSVVERNDKSKFAMRKALADKAILSTNTVLRHHGYMLHYMIKDLGQLRPALEEFRSLYLDKHEPSILSGVIQYWTTATLVIANDIYFEAKYLNGLMDAVAIQHKNSGLFAKLPSECLAYYIEILLCEFSGDKLANADEALYFIAARGDKFAEYLLQLILLYTNSNSRLQAGDKQKMQDLYDTGHWIYKIASSKNPENALIEKLNTLDSKHSQYRRRILLAYKYAWSDSYEKARLLIADLCKSNSIVPKFHPAAEAIDTKEHLNEHTHLLTNFRKAIYDEENELIESFGTELAEAIFYPELIAQEVSHAIKYMQVLSLICSSRQNHHNMAAYKPRLSIIHALLNGERRNNAAAKFSLNLLMRSNDPEIAWIVALCKTSTYQAHIKGCGRIYPLKLQAEAIEEVLTMRNSRNSKELIKKELKRLNPNGYQDRIIMNHLTEHIMRHKDQELINYATSIFNLDNGWPSNIAQYFDGTARRTSIGREPIGKTTTATQDIKVINTTTNQAAKPINSTAAASAALQKPIDLKADRSSSTAPYILSIIVGLFTLVGLWLFLRRRKVNG